jgi:hypothetical protein
MRRSVAFSVLFVVVAVAVGSCLAISLKGGQNTTDTDTTATPTINGNTTKSEVQIEGFHWMSSYWYTAVGDVQCGMAFNLTVHNLSGEDIDNLTIEIQMLNANNTQVETSIWFEGGSTFYTNNIYPIGNLSANESRTFDGSILTDWDTLRQAAGPLTARVSLRIAAADLDKLVVEVPG